MQVSTIGIDLAKNIFQVHGITEADEVAFNRPLRRAQVLPFFARLSSRWGYFVLPVPCVQNP